MFSSYKYTFLTTCNVKLTKDCTSVVQNNYKFLTFLPLSHDPPISTGIILTSHLWGYLADTKGRKNVIILSLALTTVCSLASSLASDFATIVVLRLLVGMW